MRVLLCLMLCVLVTGCKTGQLQLHPASHPARPDGMAVANISAETLAEYPSLTGSLVVEDVLIGKPKDDWVPSSVSKEALGIAIEQSLKNNGLLSADPADAPYKLVVAVNELHWALQGGETWVNSKITYKILQANGGTFYETTVPSSTDLDFLDIFDDTDRNRIATETNIRESIQKFIEAYLAYSKIVPRS